MIFDFLKNKKEEKITPKIPNEEKKIANLAEAMSDMAQTYDDADLKTLYSASVQKTPKDFVVSQYNLNGTIVNVAFDSLDDEFSDDRSGGNLQEAINDVFEMQKAGQEVIFSYYAKQGFIGFNNCSILSQDWLIQKAINAPCEDAIAVDYNVASNEPDLTEEEQQNLIKMKNVSDAVDGFNIKTFLKRFAENKRKFGQAVCIPIIDGVDYSKPFNIDAVGLHKYKGMSVVEPVWATPVLDSESILNPLSKRFYMPTWFRLPNGKMVHYSWCIFNTLGTPSDILKPSYFWGGIPLPQLLYEQTYAAHKTAKEAPMLAQSKRLNYVEVNPNSLLLDRERRKDLKFMSWLRNNFGWLTIKPDQKIGQIDTTLADFDSVVMLSYQVVAAISGVIATRLLETSPKGWQSSGSYEDKQYTKLLKNVQENDFKPILELHYRLLNKSEYGIDKRNVITFDEIDTPSAKEAAEIRQIEANTDATYVNAGVLAPDEVRLKLKEDDKSGYSALEEEDGGSETEQDFFSEDVWNEEDHPRKENGQFGEGSGSNSSKSKHSKRHNRVKNRQRQPVKVPKEDMGAIHHNIVEHGFKDFEKQRGTATRFGANYGVIVQINDATPENLSYTIIRKWKLK